MSLQKLYRRLKEVGWNNFCKFSLVRLEQIIVTVFLTDAAFNIYLCDHRLAIGLEGLRMHMHSSRK
jgi:hypothetical protein